jgi:hypothetical protein
MYSERVVFKNDLYQIERKFPDKRKPVVLLPIESWGFSKETSSIAIVKRELENANDLENPSNIVLYEIPITWTVLDNPNAKSIFLKHGEFTKIINEDLKYREFFDVVRIFVLDNRGENHEAQLMNTSEFPFSMVSVKKGKAKRITLEEGKILMSGKKCLGIFTSKDLVEVFV